MKQRTKLTTGALTITVLALIVGFTIGRMTTPNTARSDVTSPEELVLVGKWKMTIVGDAIPFELEFRSDHTMTRYNSDGTPSIVANWGLSRSNDELEIQNVQNGDAGGYMGPTILSIDKLETNIVHLSSRTNAANFILERKL